MENNGDNSEYSVDTKSKRNRSIRVLMVFIILLLIFNAFVLYQFINQKSQKEEYHEELVSTVDLKQELEKELREYEAKVAEYESLVEEKDSALVASQVEIEEKVNEIKQLIQKGDGISIIMEQAVLPEINQGKLIKVPIKGERLILNTYIFYLKNIPLTFSAIAFLNIFAKIGPKIPDYPHLIESWPKKCKYIRKNFGKI